MGERVYQLMRSVGITNLILGICIVVMGIGTGVAIIVNGARLLKNKSNLIF